MPTAVPSFFSTSALQASAPAAKPSSPQASEGSSDFQSMLGQAKPRAEKPQTNGNDSTGKSQQADKPKQKPHVSRKGKAQAVQKKASGDESTEDEQSVDGEVKDVSAAQTAAAPQATADPSAPKAVSNPRKTTDTKNTDSSSTADESQQVLAAQPSLKVQPVDQKKQQDQSQGQQQPADSTIQAIRPDDSDDSQTDDAQTASATTAVDPSPPPLKKQATAKSADSENGTAKQPTGIGPRQGSANQPAGAQSPAADVQAQPTDADEDVSDADSQPTAATSASHDAASPHAGVQPTETTFANLLSGIQPSDTKLAVNNAPALQSAAAPSSPEVQFAQSNHSTIISGIHGQLLPDGGTMQVRLDPPELGALSVIVRVHEGVMSASFETSNDQATRLLSHSLTQLKSSLEAQGVSVGKLHVTQSPKGQQSDWRNEDRPSQDNGGQDSAAQREQQRREMLRRMWRRLSGGQDPLDLVA